METVPEEQADPAYEKWRAERRIAMVRQNIERFRRLTSQTKNPLYVWEAILYSFAYDLPLPQWGLDYIKHSAMLIHDLILLVSGSDYNSIIYAATGAPDADRITAKAALKQLGKALQMTDGKEKNAFADLAEHNRLIEDAALADAAILNDDLAPRQPRLRSSGDHLNKATGTIATRRNIATSQEGGRALRRRIKKGRELL